MQGHRAGRLVLRGLGAHGAVWFVALIAAAVLRREDLVRVAGTGLGLSMAILGVALATDFRGAAHASAAEASRAARISPYLAQTYTRSPWYPRVCGVLFVCVGCLFAYRAVTGTL